LKLKLSEKETDACSEPPTKEDFKKSLVKFHQKAIKLNLRQKRRERGPDIQLKYRLSTLILMKEKEIVA